MRKIKLTATLILCAVALLLLLPGTAKAAESGTCGENVTWTLDDTGTLTISGSGPMYDYTATDLPWWCDNKNSVNKIIIEDGVTYIGDYAFSGMSVSYNGIRVPASVREVGEKAFSGVYGTVYFLGDPPTFAQDAFSSKSGDCYYLSDWPESVTQNRYGGSISWNKSKLFLRPEEKRFFALNEELTADNLPLYTNGNVSTSASWSFRVEPRSLTFSNYDGNTTYGQKTVTVHADGYDLEYTYFVTDGQNHFDLLDVQYEKFIYAKSDITLPKVKVYLGTLQLEADKDFTYTYENVDKIGHNGKLTVTGKGIYEGFTKTYPVAVLKTDMATQKISVEAQPYRCEPLYPAASVSGFYGTGEYYELLYENNTNVGQATAYVVGKGNSYGMGQASFHIVQDTTEVRVEGEKVGTAEGGITSDEIAYYEGWVMPGKFTLKIDLEALHIAYYELYRVEGDTEKLVRTWESNAGYSYATAFTHDFSDVYDKQTDTGMEIYILTFTYLDINDDIRAGACVMYIPTKVYDGEHMELYLVEDDGDFRAEYLGAYSEDGNLGVVEWESSDETIATVKKGAVTFKKPGTVTITGSYNDLSASKTVSMSALDITEGAIFEYDGAATVIYDGRFLIQGTDYTVKTTTNAGVTEVLVTGCGLFEGCLMRQFNTEGAPVDHTHSFDTSCDETCGGCEFTRVTQHSFRDRWMKDDTAHWHGCAVCGKQKDYDTHTFNPGDTETCTVCGPLREPGDVNADGRPDTDDAVYLLLHVMFGNADYPVEGGIHTDFNDDGKTDTDDAVYLLLHVMFGEEDYPLPA